MELKNKKIVFLGDSITEGYGTSSPDNCFTSLIAKDAECTTINYGIGGTRIAFQAGDDPVQSLDFSTRGAKMDDDADIVVIFGGVNDFCHGNAPIGTIADRTYHTFYGGCHQLMSSMLTKYPDKPILFITPIHYELEDDPKGYNKPVGVALLKEYVDIIREVAEYYALPLLDLYKESGLQPAVPKIREMYMPDGLHPNDAGHRLIANKILAKLRAM